MKPIAIVTEQADQHTELLKEIDACDLFCSVIDPRDHSFDVTDRSLPYSLVVNLVSPTNGKCIDYTSLLLMHYERIDIRVLNGTVGMGFLSSPVKQIILIDQSGLSTPRHLVKSVMDGHSPVVVNVEDVPLHTGRQLKQIKFIGGQAIEANQHSPSVVQKALQLVQHASLDFAIVEYIIEPNTIAVQYVGLVEYPMTHRADAKLLVKRIQDLVAPVKLQYPFDALSHMADWDAAI
jgi:hypothetical protein